MSRAYKHIAYIALHSLISQKQVIQIYVCVTMYAPKFPQINGRENW
jgi:hypothetical protein